MEKNVGSCYGNGEGERAMIAEEHVTLMWQKELNGNTSGCIVILLARRITGVLVIKEIVAQQL